MPSPEVAGSPPRVYPWGGREVLAGIGGWVGIFIAVNIIIVVSLLQRDFVSEDVGDAFAKAAEVAAYADAYLRAAATNAELPDAPAIVADQGSLQLGLMVTLLSQVLTFTLVGIVSKQSFSGLVATLGLNRYDFSSIWRPILAVFGAYLMVAIYAAVATASGIDILIPNSTVPTEITRNGLTLSIAAAAVVIGAPISEELFFRGLIFSGLVKRGFWFAALVSGSLFSIPHFDTGSFLPFAGIGVVMAWLYWSRGSLWDAIIFHFLFNLTSFSLLLATTR